ncbi:MAG: biotin--[acetyl-CoA-carboxylase] ligase [Clostridium sp.]|nr:biotin--[acetyl-CoA-carboxylase] ligase [Clostridium sp.]
MTKETILKLLLDHKGEILSGPDLSKELGVSRNSVWKAINTLRKENHQIISVKNKGYFLEVNSDGLSGQEILKNLGPAQSDYNILILDQIPSTNTYLKDHEELSHNTIVLANVQTQGRGRRGKSFYSIDEGGIYMSFLKKKNLEDYDLGFVTMASALALSEVTDQVLGTKSQVKWVNDLFVSGKKIAGILTEGTMELETRTLSSLIIGIGININTKIFP